jgi:hypothetical protein
MSTSYAEFFQNIETTIAEKLKLSCMAELVHASSTSTCELQSGGDGGDTSGSYYPAVRNKAYQELNAWTNKFYPDSPNTNIKTLPIIKASGSNGIYSLTSDGVSYTNPLLTHKNMFHVVYYACMSLFIELDVDDKEYRYEDVNYSIINGYADSSKSLEYYNTSTQEFYKRAEYWNIRGRLYELLASLESSFYINYSSKLNDLFSYIDTKQREYESSHNGERVTGATSCSSTGSSRKTSYAETFWNTGSNYSTLVSKIENVFVALEEDVNKLHIQLIGIVAEYIDNYNKMSTWLSKGDTFVSALQKTSTGVNTCLADTFAKVNAAGSFSLYSNGSMDFIYNLFVLSKEQRDASKYKNEDEHNIYLRKYLVYNILKSFNFYPNAIKIDNTLKELRNSLNI